MIRFNWRPQAAGAVAFVAALLWAEPSAAQSDMAISESALRTPWVQQLAVLQSLSGSIAGVTDPAARARLADALAVLHTALGKYETQVDKVIDRIVGDPQYPYIAAEASGALAIRLVEIHAGFDALYTQLGVQDRADVRAAQASLDELRRILQAKSPFERDVINALGSLSPQLIVGLATRWWNGEERMIAVKKQVAELREQLGSVPAGEKRD